MNNWDLVDLSAEKILGDYLYGRDKSILYRLAASDNLWERRIAIMATFAFIRKNRFADTFALAGLLLKDRHDLIHKAVGWMLREIGKRDRDAEEEFLRKHYRAMPRTMLRYAVEKFDTETKTFYLRK
jgi:3-methyladenine DNA glycosylase AlkD